MEFLNAPTSGEFGDYWFPSSFSGTPANANPGGLTGVDAAYAPTNPDLAAGLATLGTKYQLTLDDRITGEIQFGFIGRLITPMQYVIPVFRNNCATADLHSDAVEMLIALIGIIPEAE